MPSSLTAPQRVADTPPVMPSERVLGVPLALTDYEHTLDWIDHAVAAGSREYVCVAAVHTVMACQEDEALRAAVLGASFTVPDGQPLVWALNALGHDLDDRVYGPELMGRACARAALRASAPEASLRDALLLACSEARRRIAPAAFRHLSASRRVRARVGSARTHHVGFAPSFLPRAP